MALGTRVGHRRQLWPGSPQVEQVILTGGIGGGGTGGTCQRERAEFHVLLTPIHLVCRLLDR